MIELPEAYALAEEANRLFQGKTIASVETNQSPHKFAWFFGGPAAYGPRLMGKSFRGSEAHGGLWDLHFDDIVLTLGDGIRARFFPSLSEVPSKHQLRIGFSDGSQFVVSVQMYGGIWCYPEGTFENPYHQGAIQKPSPFSPAFDYSYFTGLLGDPQTQGLSAKAFLATNQRIPGLGNGCLQDVLWEAGIHPKIKMVSLDDSARTRLFETIVRVLNAMKNAHGRDTENRLDGLPGGYRTVMGSGKQETPCPRCHRPIVKEAYMGGSIYFCPECQPLNK